MPFFQPVVHSDNILGCDSLRVQRPKTKRKEKIKPIKFQGKRVYLFASKGSITLEASIVTVLFMLAVISFISYLDMMGKQLSHQIKINNIAIALSKEKFYEQIINKTVDNEEFIKQKNKLLSQINLSGEEIEEQDGGEIDIVSSFFYNVWWIHKKIQITERCIVKDWTGRNITKQQELVYITKNGRVYHSTKECSHLSLNIRKINYTALKIEKNCYGQTYKRCAICVNQRLSAGEAIFVTEDGTKYHSSLMCSGLLRNIITVEKGKVKNMPPCSRCVGE